MEEAQTRVERALDTRTIIRYQRALQIFMRLFLTKSARQLINLQRRTTVIDVYKGKRRRDLAMISTELQPRNHVQSSSSDNEGLLEVEKESQILNKIEKRLPNTETEAEVIEQKLKQGVSTRYLSYYSHSRQERLSANEKPEDSNASMLSLRSHSQLTNLMVPAKMRKVDGTKTRPVGKKTRLGLLSSADVSKVSSAFDERGAETKPNISVSSFSDQKSHRNAHNSPRLGNNRR